MRPLARSGFAPSHRRLGAEPVKATITMGGRRVTAVHVLNHDGKRTGKTLDVSDSTFTIDGSRDKTLYYEVLLR